MGGFERDVARGHRNEVIWRLNDDIEKCKLWRKRKQGNKNRGKYPVAKRKARKAAYQANCEVEILKYYW